jgi:LmbE family N-acetylglucosaminyl deacetylase
MSKIKLLVIAGHPDDEILGCYSYLSNTAYDSQTLFVCEGSSARFMDKNQQEVIRAINNREQAAISIADRLGNRPPIFLNFPNLALSATPLIDINNRIEIHLNSLKPDLVITHSKFCNNLDHSTISIAVSNLVRSNSHSYVRKILHMEIPSSTEQTLSQNFRPNHFVILDESQVEKKISLLSLYGDELQKNPGPRSSHGIKAYAAFRGIASGNYFAEAFELVRQITRNGE